MAMELRVMIAVEHGPRNRREREGPAQEWMVSFVYPHSFVYLVFVS